MSYAEDYPEFLRRKFRDLKDRRLNPGYSPYTNQVFLTQLSAEDCGVFQEKLLNFPVFIFKDVLFVSIITIQGHIY